MAGVVAPNSPVAAAGAAAPKLGAVGAGRGAERRSFGAGAPPPNSPPAAAAAAGGAAAKSTSGCGRRRRRRRRGHHHLLPELSLLHRRQSQTLRLQERVQAPALRRAHRRPPAQGRRRSEAAKRRSRRWGSEESSCGCGRWGRSPKAWSRSRTKRGRRGCRPERRRWCRRAPEGGCRCRSTEPADGRRRAKGGRWSRRRSISSERRR